MNNCSVATLACAGETRDTGFLSPFGAACSKQFTFTGVPHVTSPVLVMTYAQGHYAPQGSDNAYYHVELQGVGMLASEKLNTNQLQNCLSGPSIRWYFEISPEQWNAAVDDPVSGVGNVKFNFVAVGGACPVRS